MHCTLNQIIRDAFADSASDIFLIEGESPRIRREGEVMTLDTGVIPRDAMEEFWNSCGVDSASTLESDASWQLTDCGRLRVNFYHTLGRLAAVLRPIRNQIPALVELDLPGSLLESWMTRNHGLILITGPTGSGKSTTVASCLDWINQNLARHIVTLEDPIEFLFTNNKSLFSQREMQQDSKNFSQALRSALRQSPDVLFLGEIRDSETAVTALHAAETGHLVISTLHSSSVVETLDRFNHLLGSDGTGAINLLASQLVGILSQRLLPRLGGGVFPVLEYLQNEAVTRRWILESRFTDLQDHLLKCNESHSCSLLEYLIASVRRGLIEPEVARGACTRPRDFDRAMRGIS